MDKDKLMDAMSQIDDDILGETNKIRLKSQEKRSGKITRITKKPWFKAASAAAVLVIVVAAGSIVGNNVLTTKTYDSAGTGMYYKTAENYLLDSNLSVNGDEFAGFDGVTDMEAGTDASDEGSTMGVMPTVSLTPSAANGITSEDGELAGESGDATNNENTGALTESDVRGYIDTSLITCTLTLTENVKSSTAYVSGPVSNGKTAQKFGSINISLSADAKYWMSVSGNFSLYLKNGNEYEIVNPVDDPVYDNTTYSIGQYVGAASISQNIDLSAYENLVSGKYAIVKDADVYITIDGTEYVVPEKLYFEFEVVD